LSNPTPSIVSSTTSKVISSSEVNINESVTSSIPTVTSPVPAVAVVVSPTILKESTSISTATEKTTTTTTTSEVVPTVAATTVLPIAVKTGVSLTTTEELKLKRAARFGIAPTAEIVGKIEDSKKTARAERFGLEVKDTSVTTISNNNINGNKSTTVEVIDPKVAEALRKRADRFGVISPVLQEVELSKSVQVEQEKKKKRMERFGTTADDAATAAVTTTSAK